MKSVSLGEFKQLAINEPHGGRAHDAHAGGGHAASAHDAHAASVGDEAMLSHNYAPMFLPVDAGSKKDSGVIKVVTRQKFLDENIDHWVKWHSYRAGTVACAIGALILLPQSFLLSGVAAVGAGYCYGQFKRKDFQVNNLLKHRWLLEGT